MNSNSFCQNGGSRLPPMSAPAPQVHRLPINRRHDPDWIEPRDLPFRKMKLPRCTVSDARVPDAVQREAHKGVYAIAPEDGRKRPDALRGLCGAVLRRSGTVLDSSPRRRGSFQTPSLERSRVKPGTRFGTVPAQGRDTCGVARNKRQSHNTSFRVSPKGCTPKADHCKQQ